MVEFPATKDLKKIEHAGALWASGCMADLFSTEDFEFFAKKYRPFYETLREVEGRYQTGVDTFDPLAQHRHCRTLFAPAFGSHGALMISPAMCPTGKVPDFRFAAFEKGVVEAIRETWQAMKAK